MLIAYQVALELVAELRPLVERIRKHDNTLAKQLVDAMNSTVQNLAEGERHTGGNKRLKYEIAQGEANEVKASLDLALAWGHIADDSVARSKLRRLLGLCWGLTHGSRVAWPQGTRRPQSESVDPSVIGEGSATKRGQ
jgi:four helix bundle protein